MCINFPLIYIFIMRSDEAPSRGKGGTEQAKKLWKVTSSINVGDNKKTDVVGKKKSGNVHLACSTVFENRLEKALRQWMALSLSPPLRFRLRSPPFRLPLEGTEPRVKYSGASGIPRTRSRIYKFGKVITLESGRRSFVYSYFRGWNAFRYPRSPGGGPGEGGGELKTRRKSTFTEKVLRHILSRFIRSHRALYDYR